VCVGAGGVCVGMRGVRACMEDELDVAAGIRGVCTREEKPMS
jgi:hypothetical protein